MFIKVQVHVISLFRAEKIKDVAHQEQVFT